MRNNNVLKDKKTIRIETRAKVLEMSDNEKREASRRIFAEVAALPEYAAARTVAAFVSLPDEPFTGDFLALVHRHKRLVLPRVEGETMTFYSCAPADLVRGAFGIMEPPAEAEPCAVGDIDLMVVPGAAFTAEGLRLGRGKGFYDRYMSLEGFRAFTVGVCFSCALVDSLPSEPHDKMVRLAISN